jgi:hypothetical protein
MYKVIRFLAFLLLISTLFAMNPTPVMADDAPVSVDLRVTGSGPSPFTIDEPGYSVPSGNVTADNITINAQTAMGALIYYCQENGIDITVADYGWGAYVVQISDNTTDYNNWAYALNERVNWEVSAADQTVKGGDRVHWFNYTLNCYQLLLEIDKTRIMQGDSITANVTWTDGNAETSYVDGAEIYVSDNFGMFQPEPAVEPIGKTGASGNLTFDWNETGRFWPYAEASGDRTSISQYPVPTFIAASSNISLSVGWNFVSTPKRLADGCNTVEDVFGHIETGVHSIFLYDPSSATPWGSGMSTSDEVEPLDGIWIYSTQTDTVYFAFDTEGGPQAPPAKQLYAGWNAVGLAATENVSANAALYSVEAKWSNLRGYDAETQAWENFIINGTPKESPYYEENDLEPGAGYWLFMTSDGTLSAIM